mgnify:FL=1
MAFYLIQVIRLVFDAEAYLVGVNAGEEAAWSPASWAKLARKLIKKVFEPIALFF